MINSVSILTAVELKELIMEIVKYLSYSTQIQALKYLPPLIVCLNSKIMAA